MVNIKFQGKTQSFSKTKLMSLKINCQGYIQIKPNQVKNKMGRRRWNKHNVFLRLEKARQTRQNMTALKDNKGKLIKEQSKILELEREYYITFYETKNPDPIKTEQYIEATNIENKLSRVESNVAEGEITIDECSKSVFQMKLNKASGIDGLTV